MSNYTARDLALNLIDRPNDAQKLDFAKMDTASLQGMASALDSITTQAAMLSAYLGARGVNGIGDSGHEKATKKSEAARKRIRKAIGFTYA